MKKAYIYISITILFWGMSATVSKLFFAGLDTYYILAATDFFSWLILFLGLVINGKIKEIKDIPLKTILLMVTVGSLGIFFCNYFYQKGISLLPAQQAFVINYLWPAFVIIFSLPILHEKLTVKKLLAILLSFLGVVIVATNGNFSSLLGGSLKGILFSMMGALVYGIYAPLNKKFDYDKDIALMMTYAVFTIVPLCITVTKGTFIIPTVYQLAGIAFFGMIINGIGYLTYGKAMVYGDTAIISNLSYLTPIVSLFVTHFVLGEAITIYSVLGLLCILAGAGIQMLKGSDYGVNPKS